MDKINLILKSMGLNDKQISVYLASLELGESTVQPIARKAGVKRAHCYNILDELLNLKLVSYGEKNNRRRYFAQDPKNLELGLRDKLREFQEILPDLRSVYNKAEEKPKVRYFEGRGGLIEVYEMVKRSREIQAVADPGKIEAFLGDYFKKYFEYTMKKKMRVRELVVKGGFAAEYIRKYAAGLQEARELPEWMHLGTDMVIFGDNLALVSYGKNVHAVVIESSEVASSMKMMFEFMWRAAGK